MIGCRCSTRLFLRIRAGQFTARDLSSQDTDMYEERPSEGILAEDRHQGRQTGARDDDGGTTVGASQEGGESPGSEAATSQAQRRVLSALKPAGTDIRLYCLLFFISGFPALLYQIVWQ